ncbi:polymorphic toxin-type HINT domain-containing protein [Streptomyces sp. NPDC127084]|uniref:polymorphic toxin-type HINT domain-containing protein n=1 Tax=Streptomyces sp. NPDC127084 TaxID=3347133 RepID=UPI00364E43FD
MRHHTGRRAGVWQQGYTLAGRASRGLLPIALLAGLVSAAPAVADEPGTPPLSDRQRVVNSWKDGGPAVKAAAGSALVGNDEQIRAYLAEGQRIAEDLDLREAALKLVTEAGPSVSEAARKALEGSPEQLSAFMKDGWKAPLADDQRVEAARITEGGGPTTREAGDKAMAGSLDDIKAFLAEGQYTQRDDDARLRVAQIEASGGPATKRAASDALNGSIDDVRDFLTYGQHITRAQDQEHATITDLAQQTKDAQAAAEKARKSAEEQARKAKTAAALAKQETAKAAAETKAAKGDARRAADAARRAAESARRAASAARTAVAAARAANAAAQAAATAAHNASTAALYASQAADGAWLAANSGKVHEDIAAEADRAAAEATRIADSADAMRETLKHSSAALDAALSAINDMTASAGQADEADSWARQSGVHYGEAKAAANSARRHAAEAKRASEQARAHANAAAAAAQESAAAARSAAAHARNAAAAARKAAEHAGDAQAAADKAKANAADALAAAQKSGQALKQIQEVQDKARAREAEEVTARTTTQVNEARDAKEMYDLAKAEVNRLLQERNELEGDFAQLAIQAEQPGADPARIAAAGRKMALTALQVRGPWSRTAAETALSGDDAAVVAYATDGWKKATEQDERQQVNQIALTGAYKDLRDAAATALKGTPAEVRAFLTTGQYRAAAPDRRVEVTRIEEAGGTAVKEAASAALDHPDSKALNDFLETGQHRARLEDDRVAAARLAEGGTPEVKAAAETALASPDTQLRTFIESGRHRAKRRDQLNAAHIAQIKAITAAASEDSARAYEDAFKAAQAASDAQNDANAAEAHAKQAAAHAAEAAGYADQAKQSADSARKSSNDAAASAATARDAEWQAARSAASAEQSAAAAYASSLAAADYAASAFKAAEAAKVSATNAGMSAKDAQIKHGETVERYMIDEYNKEVQKRQAEEAAAKKRNLIKLGAGIITFLGTGMLPPDISFGVRLDLLHGGLDILGMIPAFGEVADGANCAIYAIEGTIQHFQPIGREGAWTDAGLACASMIPLAGWATTPAKWARYAEKYGSSTKKIFDDLKDVFRKAPNCPRTNSFPAGTRVLMGDGSSQPIEQIRVGDSVLATDPRTDVTGPRRVEATIYTPDDLDFTEITLDGRRGEDSVTATDNHPVWSAASKKWTAAADLNAGDSLRSSSGDPAPISKVRRWKTLQPAYNLTVNDLHTYYVLAGRTPVLVHNSNGPCGVWQSEFDDLPKGRQGHVREMPDEQTMRSAFDRWTAGAERLPARGPRIPEVYRLEDGTVIQWRTASASGGATIDISPGSGGKALKVHLP